MSPAAVTACQRCDYELAPGALFCPLCGDRTAVPLAAKALASTVPTPAPGPELGRFPIAEEAASPRGGRDPGLVYLVVALATAPVFAATPYLSLVGWFFAALVHEMGHCAVDWFFGAPAFPVLSLTAEAMTVSEPQVRGFAWVIWLGLTVGAWHLPLGRGRYVRVAVVGLLYPLLAFGAGQELLRALGGHLGELTFASMGVWRCLFGGFTNSRGERLLYGTMGFFLFGKNLWLTGGLLLSAAARSAYGSSGSFGLRNDYLVVADAGFPGGLAGVALTMSAAALGFAAASFWAWRLAVAADAHA